MNAFSVRAILAERKRKTRRVIKPQPLAEVTSAECWQDGLWRIEHKPVQRPDDIGHFVGIRVRCPYGIPGDRLWVRESFQYITLAENEWQGAPDQRRRPDGVPVAMLYRADAEAEGWTSQVPSWTPSIYMPRWASRILLELTDICVEQVQDITDTDAWEEGAWWWRYDDAIRPPFYVADGENRDCFRELWDSINAKRGYGWNVNPWVWVLNFDRVR